MRVMLINHNRQKLINSIVYFANNTRYLGKVKLCKLLYFLDFEHFKQTGRSVTGLDYFAWPMGPVPVSLYEETTNPEPDMKENIRFTEIIISKGTMLTVTPLVDFNDEFFSRRELKILELLSKEFFETVADDMVEATHLENQPWHKIYNLDNKKHERIPYELAIRKQEIDVMVNISAERNQLINHFK